MSLHARSIEGRGLVRASVALRRGEDPLEAILGAGKRTDWFAVTVGVALAAHVGFLVLAMADAMLKDIRLAVQDNRAELHELFWRQYDIEIPKEKPKVEQKEPDPPAPEPVEAPKAAVVKAPAPKDDDPYKDLPPPAPAEAGKVLVQKDDPDEIKDMTGDTVVTGNGSATYGMQSASGKGDTPTMAANASLAGVPGGRGTGAAPAAPPPSVDCSRPIGPPSSNHCPFPPEADADEINQALVTVQITVRPDGTASSATILSDPGHGFGRAARACALAWRYQPAWDRSCNPILSSRPVAVRFTR